MSDPFLGQVMMAGFDFAPTGYALCNGQILPIQQNAALFSLLAIAYGGNGTTTFALPNLQSRVPVGMGTFAGVTAYPIGSQGGAENVALTIPQMPMHNHFFAASNLPATVKSPSGGLFAKNTSDTLYAAPSGTPVTLGAASVGPAPADGGQAHNNMQPYRTINFAIALSGLYPSRP